MQENKTKRKREKRQIAQSEEKFKIMARQGMVKEYFSESKGIQNKAENIPLQEVLIFCCHKCHTLWVTFSILLLLTSFFVLSLLFRCSFYEHHLCTHYLIFLFLRLVHIQTTACFTKNNVSFSIKQRVVFPKTTARFSRFLSVLGSKSE